MIIKWIKEKIKDYKLYRELVKKGLCKKNSFFFGKVYEVESMDDDFE